MTVNQQVIQQDPVAGLVVKTLNDLSVGDFDIVVADVESSTTARQAKLWSWLDIMNKLQIPQDIALEIVMKYSDLPDRDEFVQKNQQRMQQQQQQAQQQMQMQIELERIKNENVNQSIAFKDAPLPIQMAMAAKQGLIDPQIAQYFMQTWLSQMAPQLLQQMQMQQAQAMNQAQAQMQQTQLPLTPEMMFNQPQQNQPQAMTQAAAQSVMNGITPTV